MTIEKFNEDLEIRSIQDKVNKGEMKVDEAKAKLDELRVRRQEYDKQLALASAPQEQRSMAYADMQNAMVEKRAITLQGNGAINQVTEIVTEIIAKTPLLDGPSYFYGANASNRIPLLTPGLASPSEQTEGWTTPDEDSTAALSLAEILPVGWTKTLPVSWDVLNLNSANFEAQLPAFYQRVFGLTMHTLVAGKMFHASGVDAANKVYATGSGSTGAAYPTLHDFIDLSFTMQDKVMFAPKIVANSVMMREALKTATDTATKIIAEEYYRNKSINGVPVILTSAAANVTTKDAIQVWGGDLANVGIGVASQLMIEPKKKVGDGNTYFDATMYFNAKIIQPKNSFAIIAK